MDNPLPPFLDKHWDEYLASNDQPTDLIYEGVFSHPVLFPLQRRNELQHMLQASGSPRVVYEIGADKGGGFYHWCKLPTVQRAICCEIRGTPYATPFQESLPGIDFLWMQASSYAPQSVDVVRKWLDGDQIDCLFIDGDKSAFDVDFFAYLPLMNPHGVVFMHDIQDVAPRRGYDAVIKRGYSHYEYVNIQESINSINRQDKGIEATNAHEQWLRHWRGASAGVGVIRLGG